MVSPVLKFKRGLLGDLPLLNEGEPGFTTDYYELYIGSLDGNKLIGSGRYWSKETSSSGGSVKVFEATSNGTNFVGLAAATNVSSSITFTLPSTDGSNGDVLTTDGSGNLSFSPSSSSPSSSSSFNISGNSGSDDTFNTGQTLTFLGSSNDIVTTISNNQVEIGLRDTVNITTELDVPTIEVSNIEAKDGSSSITIANSTGSVSIADSLSVSGNTRLDGNLSVGALEVGSGTTDVIVNGDMRVTGILSVGQGTITLNSEDEEIRIGQTKIKRNDNGNIEFRDSLTNRKLGIKILEEFNSLSISGVSTLGIVTGATYFGDGTGINNVDADQLDGQEGTYYLDYSNFTNTPTIPSNVSDLTNDSGFITTSFTNTNQLTNGAGFITTSFTNTNQLTNGAGFITSADGGDADQLDGQEGTYYLNYNNFTNTPTIPSNVSDLTNDSGFITSADGGDADQLDGQEGTYYLNYNNFTNTPTIPSNLSDLTNDSGFITTSFTDTSQLTNGAGFITTSFTDTSQLTNGAGFITTSFTNTNQLTNGAGFITTSFTDTSQLTNGAGFITTSFTNTNQLTNGAGFITTSFTDTSQLTNGAGFITSSDNITGNSSGLSGNPNISVSEITALSASFSGNVSIGGTLTYEDVTNVDSVGLITARNGIDVTGNITVTGTVDGRDVASDGTKLDGIESGATADQTASEILTAIKTVDGASSGLDADTLDGQEGTYYLNYNNFTNTPTIPSNVSDLTNDSGFITTSFTNTNQLTNGAGFITTSFTDTSQLTNGAGFITSADGGNADTLDGQEGTYYLNYNNFTNTPTIPTNNNQLTNGAGYITSFDITTQTDPKYLRSDASDTASGTITFTNTSTNSTLNVTGNPGAASYNFFLAASNDTGNKATHFVNGSTRTADGGANAYTIRNDGGSLILGKSSQSTILVGSGDLTYNANEVWHAGNDGSGSGLDADLLDGIQSGSFLRSDLGGQQVQSYLTINDAGNFSVLEFEDSSNVQRTHVYHANSGGYAGIGVFDSSGANRKDLLLYQNGTITWNNNTVWHAGNDGSGSGLDADTLDGVNSGSFLRSDANDYKTSGFLRFNDNLNLQMGTDNDISFFYNGNDFYMDFQTAGDSWYIRDSGDNAVFGFTESTGNLSLYKGDLNVGDGGDDSRILIKKADNNVADHIQFYNGTTRMGEIGCQDTTWLRINQVTGKNIYTPRYIRADGGFFVDGTSKGINGNGNFIGGTIAGASDYDLLATLAGNQTFTGQITLSGGVSSDGKDFYSNNGAFIANDADGAFATRTGNNIDHIWHNDTDNAWNFCSDTTYKNTGNSRINCGNIHGSNLYLSAELNLQGSSDSNKYLDARVGTNTFHIRKTTGGDAGHEIMATFTGDAGVGLYHNAVKKFETTSTGVTVTGGILASGASEFTAPLTIDSDNNADGALRIENNVSNTNNDFYFAQEIIQTLSGTQAATSDREQGGIYMDINSTNTGGDTSNEHRAYGIYIDLDSTGDADNVVGIYANATATPTTGTTSIVWGGYFFAEDNGGAGQITSVYGLQAFAYSDNADSDTNNQFGGYFKAYCAADSAAVGLARGVYSEIEINGSTDLYGTCYAYQAEIDNNTGVTQTNTTYLFYGNYAGPLPTTAYGVYITDNVESYFGGPIVSAQNITAFSDITLKKNIEVIPNALDKVSQIRGITFDRIDIDDEPRQSGVIAQEVEKVLPEVVRTAQDGTKTVAYGNMVGLLIEAIKELKAEVETLKAERN